MKRVFSLLICLFFCVTICLPMMATKVWAYSPESYFEFDSATHTITGYLGPGGAVDIPPTIGGVSVEHIGDGAFAAKAITSVVIPNGVKDIGERAFDRCYTMDTIKIPNSVSSIGGAALATCTALSSITLPNSVTSIGEYAFNSCTSLKRVTIPNSVSTIGDDAFIYCSSLTSVTFTGHAPATWGNKVFDETAPTFTIYYYGENIGFTTPTFQGYPCIPLYRINTAPTNGGTVIAPDRSESEKKIYLTVTPDFGRYINILYYTDSSGTHAITNNSFTMPSTAVTIHAEFAWMLIIIGFFSFMYMFLFAIVIYGLWLAFRHR